VVEVDALSDVIGDETQLIQLFQILVGNGIKFQPRDKRRKFRSAQPSRPITGASWSRTMALVWTLSTATKFSICFSDCTVVAIIRHRC